MPQPDDSRIVTAAYQIWLDEGRPGGRDEEHWQRAKLALSGETTQTRARKTEPKSEPPQGTAALKPKAPVKAAKTPARQRAPAKQRPPNKAQAAGSRRSTISAHQLQPAGMASSLKLYSGWWTEAPSPLPTRI